MIDPFRNIWKKMNKTEPPKSSIDPQASSIKDFIETSIETGKNIPLHGRTKQDLCLHYGDTDGIVAIDWGKSDSTQRIYEIKSDLSIVDKGFFNTGDAYIDYIEEWANKQKHVAIKIYDEETNTWETIEEK
jgi:hypothetical protein